MLLKYSSPNDQGAKQELSMMSKNEKVSEVLLNGQEEIKIEKDKNDQAQKEVSQDEQIKCRKLLNDDIDEEGKMQLLNISENITGILFSLKQNGELNVTENNYLTELCNIIYEENPEQFHEINNALLNISSK